MKNDICNVLKEYKENYLNNIEETKENINSIINIENGGIYFVKTKRAISVKQMYIVGFYDDMLITLCLTDNKAFLRDEKIKESIISTKEMFKVKRDQVIRFIKQVDKNEMDKITNNILKNKPKISNFYLMK